MTRTRSCCGWPSQPPACRVAGRRQQLDVAMSIAAAWPTLGIPSVRECAPEAVAGAKRPLRPLAQGLEGAGCRRRKKYGLVETMSLERPPLFGRTPPQVALESQTGAAPVEEVSGATQVVHDGFGSCRDCAGCRSSALR